MILAAAIIGGAAVLGILLAVMITRKQKKTSDSIYKHVSVRNGVNVQDKSYGSRSGIHFDSPNDSKGTVLADGNRRIRCILELTNMGTGEVYTFQLNDKLRIGRAKGKPGYEEKLVLPLDSQISRDHCMIMLDRNSLLIQDLNSHNHTYVNDQQITSVTPLMPGDVITVGFTRLKVRYTLQ